MSFWPFGQNFNSSNINGILEEYFHVMHGLEKQAQKRTGSRNTNNSDATNTALVAATDTATVNDTDLNDRVNNDNDNDDDNSNMNSNNNNNDDNDYDFDDNENQNDGDEDMITRDSVGLDVHGMGIGGNIASSDTMVSASASLSNALGNSSTKSQPSLIPTPRHFNNTNINIGDSAPPKSTSSSRTDSLSSASTSTSSASNPSEDDGQFTFQSLNHKFMDDILEETELLNELTRQNNTLLDFVCFGYFYSENGEKVDNIAYLIDCLLECIDRIDDDNDPASFEDDEVATDNDNENNSVTNETLDENDTKSTGTGYKRTNDTDIDNSNNKKLSGETDQLQDNDILSDIKESFQDPHSFSSASHDDSIIPMLDSKLKKKSTFLNKANIISEIFALDIWLISESLVKNTEYLNKIWSILYHPKFTEEKSPLVPIFLKINQNLLLTRQDQYLNFIRTRENLVQDMLKHIDISLLMDFFLKIIATDKQEAPTGIIELVSDQKLIDQLFSFLVNDKYSADIQACTGDFIKSIIAISANAPLDEMSIGPNSLTRELASEKCIDYLLNCIVNERGPALITAVSITIELIRKNNSDYDQVNLLTTTIKSHPPSMRDPVYLGVMLRKFSEHLVSLKNILFDIANDDSLPLLENQIGEKYKPLGFERFKVVELIAELLHCSNMGLMNSKKAERIVKERDQIRTELVKQLEEALTDLSIKPISNSSNSTAESPTELNLEDDVDESFEVPYVNDNQNAKLRSNPTVGDSFKIKLYDSQLLPIIIQLFIQYPWNNFWHNVIFDIIQQIFNGRMDFSYNSFLVYSLFSNKNATRFATDNGLDSPPIDFQITRDLVLLGYKNSHKFYETHKTTLGFMGHLVLIAEEIVKFSKVYKVDLISPDIYQVLLDEDWEFYSNDILNDTRIMYSKILGGGDYVEDGNIAGDIVMGTDQDPNSFSTQQDLHQKLREKLIEKSRKEVDDKNEKNGVIILPAGP